MSIFQEEYKQLDDRVKLYIEKGGDLTGYVSVRDGLLANFDSISGINAYYKQLVKADFPSESSKVPGHNSLVHKVLKERLVLAANLLKARKQMGEVERSFFGSIGGLSIRENRNNTVELSNHSFGWAIDIDAEFNPNIKLNAKQKVTGRRLISELTEEDLYTGEAANKSRSSNRADVQQGAERLQQVSEHFRQIFADEASLKSGLENYLRRKGVRVGSNQSDILMYRIAKAYEESIDKKVKTGEAFNNLVDLIFDRKQTATPPPPAWSLAARVAGFRAMAAAREIADILVATYEVFMSNRKATVPKAAGNLQTIGVYGFLNLTSELIAALTSSEGGGLEWLGAVDHGTKDFMHFELKLRDQPFKLKKAQIDERQPN